MDPVLTLPESLHGPGLVSRARLFTLRDSRETQSGDSGQLSVTAAGMCAAPIGLELSRGF